MKDDAIFNIQLVKVIEQHPVLYDPTHSGYTSREEQEKAWETVGEAVNETALSCKEKWKNLRAGLSRHIRQRLPNGLTVKKPYYLAEHMKFLIPYTRSRPQRTSIAQFNSPANCKEEEEDYCYNEPWVQVEELHQPLQPQVLDDDVLQRHSPPTESHMDPSESNHTESLPFLQKKKKNKMDVIEPYALAYLQNSESRREDDADMSFLKSLQPDMSRMSARQKNEFKIKVLTLIQDILYSDELPTRNSAPGTLMSNLYTASPTPSYKKDSCTHTHQHT